MYALMLGQLVLLLLVANDAVLLAAFVKTAMHAGVFGTYGGAVNGGFWLGHMGVELWGNPGIFDGMRDF